jgi:hypothetical protein
VSRRTRARRRRFPLPSSSCYRAREKQWRAAAGSKPPGKERDACMVLADGYAHLVAIIEEMNGGATEDRD